MSAQSPVQSFSQSMHFDQARRWLRDMAFIRAFETEALELSLSDPPQVSGSMHLCAGQEAVPVGAIAGLHADDPIISTYRGHGWALAAGLEPRAVMAEICHKATGINGGRGGSAYFMAPWTRFIGENSIVGAGTTIACGVALASQLQSTSKVVLVSIGDGALNQGSVHEAMAFAAARSLPVLFVIENNGWSELTATRDMFRIGPLAERAASYGMPGRTVDGSDPFKVQDAVRELADRARAGSGPALIEFVVPRLWGHYNRDIEHYRPAADRAAAAAADPIRLLGDQLIAAGAETADSVAALIELQAVAAKELAAAAVADPDPDPRCAREHVIAPSIHVVNENAAPKTIETRELKFIEAVNLALRTQLQEDDRTLVFGEDVGKSGGIFQATRYLQRDFGEQRVFDTPIAENAILGSAVGAALAGLRPIAEIMWADFIFVAIDQLINQAANIRYITGGAASVPMVVRTQQGVTPGSCAQHSQSIEALLAHIPGLKVAIPSCPNDAYALLRAAAADPDPCVVIESRAMYQTRGIVEITDQPEPVGRAKLRLVGSDALLVSWGPMVNKCLEAAHSLKAAGINVGVLDLRWLAPLDEESLLAVAKEAGGRVVLAHEAFRTGGFGAELFARLYERLEDSMTPRVRRVATPDVRMPAAPALQRVLVPDVAAIEAAARAVMTHR
jgi:2-oxoisovalerate dehydrogenase E1 component